MARGCTSQAGESRDAREKLSRQRLVVLGFSPDLVKKLKKVSVKRKLNFDLLFDEDHAIAEKHGVWGLKKNSWVESTRGSTVCPFLSG